MPLDKEQRHEVLDPTPVAAPVGWKRPYTLQEQIKRFVRDELSAAANATGAETFEESEDFDTDDDPELKSRYELDAETDALPAWKEEDQKRQAVEAAESRLAERVEKERKKKKKPATSDPEGQED